MTGRRTATNATSTQVRWGRARVALAACALLALAPGTASADEKPADEKAPGEEPAGEEPAGEKPPGEKPPGEKPAAHEPSAAEIKEAEKYWEAGEQAYKVGRFDVAAKAFERAYELTRWPKLPFSMGHAYRHQFTVDQDPRNLERAIELYREYLARVPQGRRRGQAVKYIEQLENKRRELAAAQGPNAPSPKPKRALTQLMVTSPVDKARAAIGDQKLAAVPTIRDVVPGRHPIRVEAPGYITEKLSAVAIEGQLVPVPVTLRPKPGRLAVHAPSGARIAVDGKSVDRKLLARGLEMPAGRYWVTVRQRGKRPWSQGLTLERGQEVRLAADLVTTRRRVGSYYAFGTAGVLAAATAVTAWVAHSAQSDAEAIEQRVGAEPLTPADLADYNRHLERRDNWRTATYVFLGGAVAAGLTGAFLFFFDDPGVQTPGKGSLRMTPTSGAGAAATWSREF